MKRKTTIKSLLLMAALLIGGGNVAWADDVYTILYGTPSYDTDGVTVIGVTAQTDFTAADGSIASDVTHSDGNGTNCTNAMPVGGSVLSTSPSFTHYFETAATKGTVHFEANYTTPTGNTSSNNSQAWKIVDSNGVVIFGSTDAGQNGSNATCNIGFCNGVSIGTGYYRQPRLTHNRVVLDINLSTKKVSYTILRSSGNNSYSTDKGTYDLPAAVSDVKGLTGTVRGGYVSYMDYVSFYNVYDNSATEAPYTINYQLSGITVKTVSGNGVVDQIITAETVVDGTEEGYEGNHYLITAAEAPTMTLVDGTNVLNVPVRAPYTATLNVTYKVAGVDETPIVTNFTETDAKVCTWSYAYPLYYEKSGTFYLVDVAGTYGESGTFIDGETINKTVTYTNAATDVVYFEDAIGKTSRTGASGGYTGTWGGDKSQTKIGSISLDASTYEVTFYVWAKAGNGSNHRGEQIDVNGVEVVSVTGNTNGARVYYFAVGEDNSTVDIYGKGTNKATDEIDYVLIKRTGDAIVSKSVTAAGYATYCSPYALDFSGVEGLTAYIAQKNGETIEFTPVNQVPANTGVLLKGNEGSYNIPAIASAAAGENVLVGVTEETEIAANNFVLMNGDSGVGFYKTTKEFTVSANSAYLPASVAEGRTFIGFDDDAQTTGIQAVNSEKITTNGGIYNLNGQRVEKATKGLYIVNGKKTVKN